ncbi:MerR family transcriptional regulator [Adlercreutzia sp. ZJ141]|uniref:MerR family transcriptional regulator n=1 Tax=Adlercreutzia sp. ZJ141 TaxID=2709406 RepID=UPI0013E9E155|nr:MerR family transcriptional regulator [Adlercreutzia sp. ZJ141]
MSTGYAGNTVSTGYTAKQLANMAGVSVRTLHYYEQLGLLSPVRDANNWRRYGAEDVAALRVIRTLRSCGLPLGDLKELMEEPDLDVLKVLSLHRRSLLAQQDRLNTFLRTTDILIEKWKDVKDMTDEEAFETLKQSSVEHFEEAYGKEARKRYGDEVIDQTNARMSSMSREEWDTKEYLERAIKDKLREMLLSDEVSDADASELAEMHARWIRAHWGDDAYSPQAHVALAKGYLQDERFVTYYDSACGDGATALLAEIIERVI